MQRPIFLPYAFHTENNETFSSELHITTCDGHKGFSQEIYMECSSADHDLNSKHVDLVSVGSIDQLLQLKCVLLVHL